MQHPVPELCPEPLPPSNCPSVSEGLASGSPVTGVPCPPALPYALHFPESRCASPLDHCAAARWLALLHRLSAQLVKEENFWVQGYRVTVRSPWEEECVTDPSTVCAQGRALL